MDGIEFSLHARDMLRERKIAEEWVWRAIQQADHSETASDGTTHYIKAIPEFGGRFLRVVVNVQRTPQCVVTVFFDRRLRTKS